MWQESSDEEEKREGKQTKEMGETEYLYPQGALVGFLGAKAWPCEHQKAEISMEP